MSFCRLFLSNALSYATPGARAAYVGCAVLGDDCTGFTVELRDGKQIHVGRQHCKYCARAEALGLLVGQEEDQEKESRSITNNRRASDG